MTTWQRISHSIRDLGMPTIWGLALALAVGLILRIIGITWGYPYQLHVDEPTIFNEAVDMAARRSFEPTTFYRPDHVQMKLSFIAYMVYSWGFLQQPVEVAFENNSVTFRLISRIITVAFGLALIVLAFFVARAIRPGSGVIAAWIFSLYPAYVEHSRLITPDIPLATIVLAASLAMIYYLRAPSIPTLLITSALTGVAIGIKYPGALVTVLIAFVVIYTSFRDRQLGRIARHGITAFFATLLSTFMVSPALFANFGQVYAALIFESRGGEDGPTFLAHAGEYVGEFVTTAGLILVLLGLLGTWWAVRVRREEALVLIIGPIFWLGLSPLGLQWERWGTPMWLTPLILGAVGFHVLWNHLRFLPHKLVRSFPIVVGVIVFAQLFSTSVVGKTVPYVLPDTRVTGIATLDQQGFTAENTETEGFSPLRPSSSRGIAGRFDTVGTTLTPRNTQFDFALISSIKYKDAFGREPRSADAAFYRELDRTYPLVLEISPTIVPFESTFIEPVTLWRAFATAIAIDTSTTVGPTIRVYDLRAPISTSPRVE